MEIHAMAPTPDDLSRYIEALRQELAELEVQRTAMLTQHGSGAVASDGSMAGGERAVLIGGAAEGNIITTGDRAQIVQVRGNVYLGQPSRDPDEALAIYRRVLVASTQQMSLRGLG